MARIKLDECLSRHVAPVFAAKGHEVATVRGQGWGGLKDEELFPRVGEEKRIFITTDLGFANTRKYAPGSHSGILVLRAERESRRLYEALARNVVASLDLDQINGALVVASPAGIRIRRR